VRADAIGVHYHGVWRKLDDPVLPTRGRVWSGQIGAGQARSDPGGSGPFTRLYARLDAFHPLGNWFGNGRIELGQVFAKGSVIVPEALRFRAGGDESVRGYAYRSLTRRVNGIEVGSEVLFTASAELARPILERLPELWGAVFVDAGNAAGSWGELQPAVGVGAGVRYRSPIGPVKLDLAYGEAERRWRLHLTVGLSF
jgi:translocation and assembly module TamA